MAYIEPRNPLKISYFDMELLLSSLLFRPDTSPAAVTVTPSPVESDDEADSLPSEGLPKVASTSLFLIALFFVSVGLSGLLRYVVFARESINCCCDGKNKTQSAVSPETEGLKDGQSRGNTPENNNIRTGLYANIFARAFDSDEEEIRQLELEAQLAEEQDDDVGRPAKKARVSKTAILQALATANRQGIGIKRKTENVYKGEEEKEVTVVRELVSMWKEKALTKADKGADKIPGMVEQEGDLKKEDDTNNQSKDLTMIDEYTGRLKEKALGESDENANTVPGMVIEMDGVVTDGVSDPVNHTHISTTAIVHRNASPLPSISHSVTLIDNDAGISSNPDTPRTIALLYDDSVDWVNEHAKSNGACKFSDSYSHNDLDGYSADFETISFRSNVSNLTELQKSMDARSLRKLGRDSARTSRAGKSELANSAEPRDISSKQSATNGSKSANISPRDHPSTPNLKHESPYEQKPTERTEIQNNTSHEDPNHLAESANDNEILADKPDHGSGTSKPDKGETHRIPAKIIDNQINTAADKNSPTCTSTLAIGHGSDQKPLQSGEITSEDKHKQTQPLETSVNLPFNGSDRGKLQSDVAKQETEQDRRENGKDKDVQNVPSSSRRTSQTSEVYAKYASNSSLPNKHIIRGTKTEDEHKSISNGRTRDSVDMTIQEESHKDESELEVNVAENLKNEVVQKPATVVKPKPKSAQPKAPPSAKRKTGVQQKRPVKR